MGRTATIFMKGRSQAVRIPEEFAFKGVTKVTIRRDGKRLIIEPAHELVRKSWLTLDDDTEPAGDDFLSERPDLFEISPDRVELKISGGDFESI